MSAKKCTGLGKSVGHCLKPWKSVVCRISEILLYFLAPIHKHSTWSSFGDQHITVNHGFLTSKMRPYVTNLKRKSKESWIKFLTTWKLTLLNVSWFMFYHLKQYHERNRNHQTIKSIEQLSTEHQGHKASVYTIQKKDRNVWLQSLYLKDSPKT